MVELRPQANGTVLVAPALLVMVIPDQFKDMDAALEWMREHEFIETSPNVWEPN